MSPSPPTPRPRRSVPPGDGAAAAAPGRARGCPTRCTACPPVGARAPPVTPTQPQVAPLASLLVRSGALKGRRLPVKVPVVNIGRADFNDVVIADPSVSTSHAKLQRRDDIWMLTDLGSTNGTFVEGERLTGEVALGPGHHGQVRRRRGAVRAAGRRRRRSAGRRHAGAVGGPAAARPRRRPTGRRRRGRSHRGRARPPPDPRRRRPTPSGPPAWLITALDPRGAAAAYFLLR